MSSKSLKIVAYPAQRRRSLAQSPILPTSAEWPQTPLDDSSPRSPTKRQGPSAFKNVRPYQRRRSLFALTCAIGVAVMLTLFVVLHVKQRSIQSLRERSVEKSIQVTSSALFLSSTSTLATFSGEPSAFLSSSSVLYTSSTPEHAVSSSTYASSTYASSSSTSYSDYYYEPYGPSSSGYWSSGSLFSTSNVHYPVSSPSAATISTSSAARPSSSAATTGKVKGGKSKPAISTKPAKTSKAKISTKSQHAKTTASRTIVVPTFLANPVQLNGHPEFLGNVTSNNTYDVRDLGWQGNIGDTWINIYADTIPCRYSNRTGCYSFDAPNSASIPITPTKFMDIDTGPGGQHVRIFCPHTSEETGFEGLWLSNVVEVTPTLGVTYYFSFNRSQGITPHAGGIGVVDASGPLPVCTRPTGNWWNSTYEPFYGDHGAIVGQDGYIYAYGGRGHTNNTLFLTRVLQKNALNIEAYEYWNGTEYTLERLINPTPDQGVLEAGQGSVIYSPYYGRYMYFTPGCWGTCIEVRVAERPEGPWSQEVSFWGSGGSPDHYYMYAPAVQPKWSDPEMKNLVIMYTGEGWHNNGTKFGNILQAIRVNFL